MKKASLLFLRLAGDLILARPTFLAISDCNLSRTYRAFGLISCVCVCVWAAEMDHYERHCCCC